MREKEASVKSIFLLHCKGWEYSCLLLSTESSWRMSDVWAQQCKIRFSTSVHICMKPSKYTMCVPEIQGKEGNCKKVWIVESKSLPEMLWSDGVAFCLLSAAIKVDFTAYHLLQELTFWGLFDIGRHGEKCWKPSCSSRVQTENVLGIPVRCWTRSNMLCVSVCVGFFQPAIMDFFWCKFGSGTITEHPCSLVEQQQEEAVILALLHFCCFVFSSTWNQFLFSSVQLSHLWPRELLYDAGSISKVLFLKLESISSNRGKSFTEASLITKKNLNLFVLKFCEEKIGEQQNLLKINKTIIYVFFKRYNKV